MAKQKRDRVEKGDWELTWLDKDEHSHIELQGGQTAASGIGRGTGAYHG
jgi:hypothetical protein